MICDVIKIKKLFIFTKTVILSQNHTKTKNFEEISRLGDGAFGVVTKCRDLETGEIVAIKKMKQRIASFEECLQLNEVKSLRKMKHKNVSALFKVFRENDHLYLVFELLGSTLINTINDNCGTLPESEIRYIASQILEGLAYVHKSGFFHRDMKPENLMWSGDILKIADFGLAREIRSRPPYTEYISTRWYRAPEIVLHHEFYNSPVDIWAVGVIIAELYTGHPLFQGTSETDQFFKICSVLGPPTAANWPNGVQLANKLGLRLPSCAPVPLSTLIPNASPEAIDLINQLLRYDPAKRPSASQALQHPYFKGEMTPPSKVGKTETPKVAPPNTVTEKAPQVERPKPPVAERPKPPHPRKEEKKIDPKISANSDRARLIMDVPDFDDVFQGIDL